MTPGGILIRHHNTNGKEVKYMSMRFYSLFLPKDHLKWILELFSPWLENLTEIL